MKDFCFIIISTAPFNLFETLCSLSVWHPNSKVVIIQPPPEILKSQDFMFILVVKKGGNNHTVKNNIVQDSHIGFK